MVCWGWPTGQPRSAGGWRSTARSSAARVWPPRCRSAITGSRQGLTEIAHDREDATMLGRRRLDVELAKDRGHVLLNCRFRHDERLGDPAIGLALGHLLEHFAVTWAQLVQR